MFKIIGKISVFLAILALGYAICYYGWLPNIINWCKSLIK